MSDTAYPTFQHYGTNAQRLAFTPSPAAGTQPLYTWYETDTGLEYQYTTGWVGPFTSGGSTPIDVTSSTTVQTNTGWVVPESLTIDAGVILEIAGGARVEITGPVAGQILQVAYTETGAVAIGTTVIPHDDTIPQITEGDLYMTRTFVPRQSGSTLKVDVVFFGGASAVNLWLTVALFQDSTANALAAGTQFNAIANSGVLVAFTHYLTSTTSTTFTVRAGRDVSGTTTFNGDTSTRRFGGVMASSITVTEIAV